MLTYFVFFIMNHANLAITFTYAVIIKHSDHDGAFSQRFKSDVKKLRVRYASFIVY
jgi:hypothetical protein